VRLTELCRFFGIERRMDAAKDDVCAARARLLADAIAVHRVAGMDADANDVTRRDGLGSHGSSVSSVMIGSPYCSGVAAARTNNHRGVMTQRRKPGRWD